MDPMALGRKGEEEAVRYLEDRGWKILGRNVRQDRKEVDVIAFRDGVLAFIEVKCRTSRRFGHPVEAITWRKRREIAWVARAWLRARTLPSGTLVRFDAISVLCPAGEAPQILHLPDAWRMD